MTTITNVGGWTSLAVCTLIFIIVQSIYRLYFHPLAKFPGPRLAALTDYWELYQDFFVGEGGHFYLELDNLHKTYGPIVRVRPNEVHVKDSQWMEVLYPNSSERRDRDPVIGTALGTSMATVGTGPFPLHRVRKAVLASFFSTRSVAAMETLLQQHAAEFRLDMAKRSGEIFDFRTYSLAWTTDVVTDVIFHKRAGLFWNPEPAQEWLNLIYRTATLFPITKHFSWLVTTGLEFPVFLWDFLFPKLAPFISKFKELHEAAIVACADFEQSKTKDLKEDEKDIFQAILSSGLPAREKSAKRMANEVFNLLIAGSITVSKTACYGMYHILLDPDILAKLHAELDEAIPDPSVMPRVGELKKLRYLNAVIKETMRISCLVASRLPMISPGRNLQYGEWDIPAGMSVSMTYAHAAMDPSIFPEPQMFKPDRWLQEGLNSHVYERFVLPFGRGSRVCVGQHLAYAKLYLIFASLFRGFDIELFDTDWDRDIKIVAVAPLREASLGTKGIQIRVNGARK